MKNFIDFKHWRLTGIHDTPHRAEPHHIAHAHLPEVPVLSRPHVHLPASVVGLLIHQPVAIHDVAGLAVRHAVTIHDVVTVVHQLVHLASKVRPLVDPHPEGASVLLVENKPN